MGYDPFSENPDKEAASFLGGGNVGAVFPEEGFTVEGTVLDFRMRQRTDMESGEPLYWQDKKAVEESKLRSPSSAVPNNACKQMVIDLQGEPTGITWETADYIEKAVDDDDGIRSLYVKGGLQKALSLALRNAGVKLPERGGYLKVTRGKDGPQARKGWRRPHTFTVVFTPADKNEKAATDFLGGDDDESPFGDD